MTRETASNGGLLVEGLRVDYLGAPALQDFSLRVDPGSVHCVIGRNGAGKSSALLAVAGFVTPAAGTIGIGGRAVRKAAFARCRRDIGLVVKGRVLFGSLTLEENLALARVDADEFFSHFPQLRSRRHVRAGQLSGGQQQLAAVGRALLRDVRVVLLDELTFGLSPAVRTLIAAKVRQLAEERDLSVVVVEQHVDTALEIADHTLVLEEGRTVFEAPRDRLLDHATAIEDRYLTPHPTAHT